jgi:hypothetical protein
MTQHKDRKQAIRARMDATGEPYSEAARQLSAAQDEARLAERAEAEAVRRCNACTFPASCSEFGRCTLETANLVAEITQAYRDHAAEAAGPEIIAVPGRVLGGDIEGQAEALADDAARLAELLAGFSQEPRRSMDAIAVFRGLSRAAESMAAAAAELHRQEWFDLEDDAEPEAIAAWDGALEGLKSAAGTFEWIADGWI